MEKENIIIVSVFGAAWAVLFFMVVVLCVVIGRLSKTVSLMQATGRLRVQKLKMNPDKNHAFHNPALVPDEELTRRGYSMYMGSEPDIEAGHNDRYDQQRERQTGGHFVEDLTRELENRQRQSTAPPFLLQGIEENKRRSKAMRQTSGRPSDTNPNFIY